VHHELYIPPPVSPPPAFKENANWKTAVPSDAVIRGAWWEIFGDQQLNALEQRIEISNQNLKGAQAQFEQARTVVRINHAGLFPQVTGNPAIAVASQSQNRATPAVPGTHADFLLAADATYEADVWGRVRGTVAVSRALAQATAADLESVRLSVHAELATDYFALRGLDTEKRLLDTTVEAYRRALELTDNRYRGGLASQADVAQAQTQLETTRAQAVDVQVARAAFEHAIAVLVGESASTFQIAPNPLDLEPPPIPAGLPSALLERRPDVAGSERRVAAANDQIGVTKAAYYPLISLNGTGGLESASVRSLLASTSGFWAVGPAVVATLFDAGRRHAVTDQARAEYQQSVASYQDTVLVAFKEVEDSLAALRILEEEARIQAAAVDAAERSLTLATNRYRGGVTSYLEVITAQSAALANERVAVNILARRLTASVLLIKALGGGWNVSTLPSVAASGK
jgi:NodT family efflux transporter outer membrane factor (OMF) lipoprotein